MEHSLENTYGSAISFYYILFQEDGNNNHINSILDCLFTKEEKTQDTQIADDCINFHNGNTYKGDFRENIMQGKGKFSWGSTGVRYIGDFKGNTINGHGTFVWPNGGVYIGELENGKRYNYGIQYILDTSDLKTYAATYSRFFLESNFKNKYEGNWINGKKNGKGRMDYRPDGESFYDGEWTDGKPDGFGYRRYPDGSIYEGDWLNGRRHGIGKMIWADWQEFYSGKWQNGLQHGEGLYIWQIRRVKATQYPCHNAYYGGWVGGKRQGFGTFVYPNGSKCSGMWLENAVHGEARLVLKNGESIDAYFENDQIIHFMKNGVATMNENFLKNYRFKMQMPVFKLNTEEAIQLMPSVFDTTEVDLKKEYFDFCNQRHINWSVEFKMMENFCYSCLQLFRRVYQYYAGLNRKNLSDRTLFLYRMEFWQLLRDCGFTLSHGIVDLVTTLNSSFEKVQVNGSQINQPFDRILFAEFINSLVILAVNIFGQNRTPSEAVGVFLTKRFKNRACILTGPIYANEKKTIIIQNYFDNLFDVFQLYPTSLQVPAKEEPMNARTFLKLIQHCHLLDAYLSLENVIEVLAKTHPRVRRESAYNMDIKLSFLEFTEALVLCAELILENYQKAVQAAIPATRLFPDMDMASVCDSIIINIDNTMLHDARVMTAKKSVSMPRSKKSQPGRGLKAKRSQVASARSDFAAQPIIQRSESALLNSEKVEIAWPEMHDSEGVDKSGEFWSRTEPPRHDISGVVESGNPEADDEVDDDARWEQAVSFFFTQRLLPAARNRIELFLCASN